MTDRALVLAGGGLAGIAWEVGMLVGIRDGWVGLDDALAHPDTLFVGTSAGSAVAAQVAAGVPLEVLFEGQQAEEAADFGAVVDPADFDRRIQELIAGATSPQDAARRIGAMAIAASEGQPTRDDAIRSRLLVADWPDRQIRVTAVDAETGEFRVFTPDGDVSMADAISASCAVPGVWPVVSIGGARYMDGGVRSATNADLAAGASRVLVLDPTPEAGPVPVPDAELGALAPAPVEFVRADATSTASFGANPLDPAVRPASALAGRAQGRVIAERVAELFG